MPVNPGKIDVKCVIDLYKICKLSESESLLLNSELLIWFKTILIYLAVISVLAKYLPDQNKFSAVLLGKFSIPVKLLDVE